MTRHNPKRYLQKKLAADPTYTQRVITRPAMWDETTLTEKWEDRKERRALERSTPQ